MPGNDLVYSLPAELQVRILHFCSIKDILRFAATCQQSLELVQTSASLQLHIELEANGLEIVNGSVKEGATYPEILDELQQYCNAWLDLDIKPPVPHDLDWSPYEAAEIQGGSYVTYSYSSPDYDSIQITHLAVPTSTSSLQFHSGFKRLAADINQEVALLAKALSEPPRLICIHACSTVTGLAHPSAKQHIMTIELDFGADLYESSRLQIVDELCVAKFAGGWPPCCEVLILNWTQGVLLHKLGFFHELPDFALLDRQHLVLSSTGFDANQGTTHISLLVYNMLSPPVGGTTSPDSHFTVSTYPSLAPILKFDFPQPRRPPIGPKQHLVQLKSNPAPGQAVRTNSAAFSYSHAITLGMTLHSAHTSHWIIISGECLLNYIHGHLSRGRSSTATLAWNEWGESATRWFVTKGGPIRSTALFGSRLVFSRREESSLETQMVGVVDFNTMTARRHAGRFSLLSSPPNRSIQDDESYQRAILHGEGLTTSRQLRIGTKPRSETPSEILSVAETITAGTETLVTRGFEEPVASRLPYRIVTKIEPVPGGMVWVIASDCLATMGWGPHKLAFGLNVPVRNDPWGCNERTQ